MMGNGNTSAETDYNAYISSCHEPEGRWLIGKFDTRPPIPEGLKSYNGELLNTGEWVEMIEGQPNPFYGLSGLVFGQRIFVMHDGRVETLGSPILLRNETDKSEPLIPQPKPLKNRFMNLIKSLLPRA